MWQTLGYVALGGAFGSVLRYLSVAGAVRLLGAGLYGVLFVNILGSFAAGFIAFRFAPTTHPLLITGFLGGFTTFSAFSLDALRLWEGGAPISAVAYVLSTVLLSLLAVGLGALVARSIA